MNGLKEETKRNSKLPHALTLDNRKSLIISGVTVVDSFDDKTIDAVTDIGKLTIKGENLSIKKLSLDELGNLEIEGKITELIYKDTYGSDKEGFFSKLFR